jgi:signal transduction histidine kinase
MTSMWRTSGWILLGSALILALSLGVRHGFGLFLAPMSAEFGWGRGTFALAIALQNLVANAVEHSPAGGRITVSLRQLDGEAELTVEDEGPGIDEASLSRVFERFYRAPGSSGEGSGLGLAIVREIARGFGAEAGYRSSAEGGACFFVRFPALA